MIEKIFHLDPYLSECDARIVEMRGNEIKLDRTIFFALTGGQASDSGEIGGIKVLEAAAKGEDIIYLLERETDFRLGQPLE